MKVVYCKKNFISDGYVYYTKGQYYSYVKFRNDYNIFSLCGINLGFYLDDGRYDFREYFYTITELRKVRIEKLLS
jgi:hypothetical protein